ncbi:MAG: SRPBCC family protein, partial [Cyanobacteria bacterium]|nr:SRPBCC family protein [Cyanobacteriota bacterium]
CAFTTSCPDSFANPAQSAKVPIAMMSLLERGDISHCCETINKRNFHVSRVVVDGSPENVWSVLTDYDNATSVTPHLKGLKILSSANDKKKIWFSVESLGGMWKFDYVLNVHELKPLHRIEWQRDSGAFKSNEGYWELKPVDDGRKTLVTYAKHIDGGLMLPRIFVDAQLKKTMPEVLQSLRVAVKKRNHIANAAN